MEGLASRRPHVEPDQAAAKLSEAIKKDPRFTVRGAGLARNASPSRQLNRRLPVQKADLKADGIYAVYSVPDRKLLGVAKGGDLREQAKRGDEVVLDQNGNRWFVDLEDVGPLESPSASVSATPQPKTPTTQPQAVDGGTAQRIGAPTDAALEPVAKQRLRAGAAVAYIEALGSTFSRVRKSYDPPSPPGDAFSTGLFVYRRVIGRTARKEVEETINAMPAEDRRLLKRYVQASDAAAAELKADRKAAVAKALKTPLGNGSLAGLTASRVLALAFLERSQ